MKKIIISLFITTLIFPLSYAQTPEALQPPECPIMEERELMDKINSGERLLIIDVRQPKSYKEGHIPGAISIPSGRKERMKLEINKKDKVVIISDDVDFAKIVCRNVIANKHPVAYSLKGGMNSWNGPVEE